MCVLQCQLRQTNGQKAKPKKSTTKNHIHNVVKSIARIITCQMCIFCVFLFFLLWINWSFHSETNREGKMKCVLTSCCFQWKKSMNRRQTVRTQISVDNVSKNWQLDSARLNYVRKNAFINISSKHEKNIKSNEYFTWMPIIFPFQMKSERFWEVKKLSFKLYAIMLYQSFFLQSELFGQCWR